MQRKDSSLRSLGSRLSAVWDSWPIVSCRSCGPLSVFDLGSDPFDLLISAMRLTTFLTTIRVCPLNPPKSKTLICKGNQTSMDAIMYA